MATNHDDDQIPSIVPERDELVYHRKKKRGNSIPLAQEAVVVRASGGVRFLLTLLTLGLFATGGGAYFFYQQGMSARTDLQAAAMRISELENRLSAVGETTEESTLGLLRRIETNFSEIDKLWAARNENRTNIASNKTALENQAKTVASLESAVSNQGGILNQNATALTNLDNRLTTITGNIAGIGNLGQQLTALNADLNRVKASMSTLESDMTSRVNNAEQDIESINAYRLQMNQTVSTLQDSINRLQQRLGP
ncbi:MAG: hypothetical protein RQ899_01180 [Pseudomonadales bacterium]|nr:hypothetical protein [Pseudomonadales bacterium]